jgi:hypothetical protein
LDLKEALFSETMLLFMDELLIVKYLVLLEETMSSGQGLTQDTQILDGSCLV